MAKHYCNHAGCRELVPLNVRYCQKHTIWGHKETYKHRMEREGRWQKFYKSTAWKKLSRSFLTANPICIECYREGIVRKADIVDHVIPIKDDWNKRLDENNLQPLCLKHHNRKTRIETENRKRK